MMKKIITLILFLNLTNAVAQISTKTITGVITEVQPKFLGAQSLTVGKTELVLMADQDDTTKSKFLINKEFSNILIKDSMGHFILNPHYKGKPLHFLYYVNGKGWNCIKQISIHISNPLPNKKTPQLKK